MYNPDLPAYANPAMDQALAKQFYAVVTPTWPTISDEAAVWRQHRDGLRSDLQSGVQALIDIAHPKVVRPTTARYIAGRHSYRPFGTRHLRGY